MDPREARSHIRKDSPILAIITRAYPYAHIYKWYYVVYAAMGSLFPFSFTALEPSFSAWKSAVYLLVATLAGGISGRIMLRLVRRSAAGVEPWESEDWRRFWRKHGLLVLRLVGAGLAHALFCTGVLAALLIPQFKLNVDITTNVVLLSGYLLYPLIPLWIAFVDRDGMGSPFVRIPGGKISTRKGGADLDRFHYRKACEQAKDLLCRRTDELSRRELCGEAGRRLARQLTEFEIIPMAGPFGIFYEGGAVEYALDLYIVRALLDRSLVEPEYPARATLIEKCVKFKVNPVSETEIFHPDFPSDLLGPSVDQRYVAYTAAAPSPLPQFWEELFDSSDFYNAFTKTWDGDKRSRLMIDMLIAALDVDARIGGSASRPPFADALEAALDGDPVAAAVVAGLDPRERRVIDTLKTLHEPDNHRAE